MLRVLLTPEWVTGTLASAYYAVELVTPEVIEGALRPQQVRDRDLV